MHIDVNGIGVHDQLCGPNGAPWLVCLHSLATALGVWEGQAGAVPADHRVLRLDMSGHGGSGASPPPCTLDLLVSDVVAVLDGLGIDRCDVMGLSIGAMLALGLAIHHPHRVDRVIAADATADAPAPYVAMWDAATASIPEGGLGPVIETALERWFSPAFRESQPGTVARGRTQSLQTSIGGFIGCARAVGGVAYRSRLDQITAPTVFITAENDPAAPPATMSDMASRVAGAQFPHHLRRRAPHVDRGARGVRGPRRRLPGARPRAGGPVKFGLLQTVQWPAGSDQRQQYRNAVAQSVLAEELGYHSVWMTRHHFTRHAITSDSLSLLTYPASRTQRIRLGTAVAVLPLHDPVRLAESTALLDQLSDGRLDVGIGRGYQWTEYNGFGIGLDEGNDRFEEALAFLIQSWANAPFAFECKYHSYDAAFPQPRSIQRPHPPRWHATASAGGLRRCAQNGWGVLMPQGTPPEAIRNTVGLYREQLDSLALPWSSDKLVLARGMYCAPTTAEAVATYLRSYQKFLQLAAKVSAPPPDELGAPHRNPFQIDGDPALQQSLVCGDPDECRHALEGLQKLGIEYVIFFVNLGGLEHERIIASLRLFAKEAMPRFSS